MVVAFDFFVTIVCVVGGAIAAVFSDGTWWVAVVALVSLATFSVEARRLFRRLAGSSAAT